MDTKIDEEIDEEKTSDTKTGILDITNLDNSSERLGSLEDKISEVKELVERLAVDSTQSKPYADEDSLLSYFDKEAKEKEEALSAKTAEKVLGVVAPVLKESVLKKFNDATKDVDEEIRSKYRKVLEAAEGSALIALQQQPLAVENFANMAIGEAARSGKMRIESPGMRSVINNSVSASVQKDALSAEEQEFVGWMNSVRASFGEKELSTDDVSNLLGQAQ